MYAQEKVQATRSRRGGALGRAVVMAALMLSCGDSTQFATGTNVNQTQQTERENYFFVNHPMELSQQDVPYGHQSFAQSHHNAQKMRHHSRQGHAHGHRHGQHPQQLHQIQKGHGRQHHSLQLSQQEQQEQEMMMAQAEADHTRRQQAHRMQMEQQHQQMLQEEKQKREQYNLAQHHHQRRQKRHHQPHYSQEQYALHQSEAQQKQQAVLRDNEVMKDDPRVASQEHPQQLHQAQKQSNEQSKWEVKVYGDAQETDFERLGPQYDIKEILKVVQSGGERIDGGLVTPKRAISLSNGTKWVKINKRPLPLAEGETPFREERNLKTNSSSSDKQSLTYHI